MPYKNSFKNTFTLLASTVGVEISRLVKFSFILGSRASFFSAINIVAPMVGVLGGIQSGLRLYITQSLIKWFLLGGSVLPYLGYHIPHLFASAYWNYDSKLLRLFVPTVCMLLFLVHPVGFQAWPYAMLWLTPIIIGLIKNKNIMLCALGSTFTAHAVGSVFWIYSMPMVPQAWIALIPVAIVERILFAMGMVIVYYGYSFVKSYLSKKQSYLYLKSLLQQS